ncbi:Spindle assembly abnormal protein 6 [Thoreauomyces humboldtii]|nr:Spindle assembly abnormal protein 6 [Thoreauomyces humboldtii]
MESEKEVLFDKSITVTVKQQLTVRNPHVQVGPRITLPAQGANLPDTYQEKRRPNISVQVSLASRNSGRVKVLELRLTDEADPFFLYHLEVGEDDFHALKEEQHLLVDFQQFPLNFIELLEACRHAKHEPQPKFIAQLNTDSITNQAVFQIVETNTFRNITHISLQLIPGDDISVKQYLAQLVKDLKIETATLRDQLNATGTSLAGRLKDAESMAANLGSELERTRLANAEQVSRLKLQHAEDSARERESFMRQREDDRLAAERDKRTMEIRADDKANVEEALEMHKSKNARLDEGLKRATEEINKGNEIIRRLQTELKSAKAKLKLKSVVTLQQERLLDEKVAGVQSQQKEASDLRDSLAAVRAELQTATSKIDSLTKEVQEGKAIIEDNNHVIEWLHKQLNEDALTRPLPGYGATTSTFQATGYDRTSAKPVGDGSISNSGLRDVLQRTSPTGYRSRYLSGMAARESQGTSNPGLRPPFSYSGLETGYRSGTASGPSSPPKTQSAGLGSTMGGLVGSQGGERMANAIGNAKGNGVSVPAAGKSNYF